MFGRSKPRNRIDTLIGVGTRVDGNVQFKGGLRIDGQVNGSVIADDGTQSTLVLSEKARIEGEIHVTHAVINGTVVGSVRAAEYVELQAKANVAGDVYYKSLETHQGAVVHGRLVHQGEAAEKIVSLKPAAHE
ncbi:MAG: bactofilin family protein [Burkholderiales bacterium]